VKRPKPAKKSDSPKGKARAQYAALPLAREPDGSRKVMLVTSRETKRWVIPKGWPIKGLKPHDTAGREAYEEAGLVGPVRKRPIGSYTYEKRLKERQTVTCEVEVFLMKVERRLKRWPEKKEREGRWFTLEEAAEAVDEEGLAALIRTLTTSKAAAPQG
jgi:8-oxo-dGTP pyrophosphatase MutT (NUDIX family)